MHCQNESPPGCDGVSDHPYDSDNSNSFWHHSDIKKNGRNTFGIDSNSQLMAGWGFWQANPFFIRNPLGHPGWGGGSTGFTLTYALNLALNLLLHVTPLLCTLISLNLQPGYYQESTRVMSCIVQCICI